MGRKPRRDLAADNAIDDAIGGRLREPRVKHGAAPGGYIPYYDVQQSVCPQRKYSDLLRSQKNRTRASPNSRAALIRSCP